MQDQLISFETAKLAKQKGFNFGSYILGGWGEYGEETNSPELGFKDKNGNYNNPNNSIYKSTQSLLQKWLREKHDIHIVTQTGSGYNIWWSFQLIKISTNELLSDKDEMYATYEEALEIALQEVLESLNT